MRGCVVSGWACLVVMWSAVAMGHNGNTAGIRPRWDANGELLGAATAMGLVRQDPDKLRFFGGYPGDVVWAELDGQGRVLVGGQDGVFVTSNWGCTWSALDGPPSAAPVHAMTRSPDSGRPLLLATASVGTQNAIYHSPDGGLSWQALPGTEGASVYTSLVWSRAAQRHVAVSAAVDEGSAPTLHIGDASGQSWTTLPLPWGAEALPRVLTALGESQVLVALWEPNNGTMAHTATDNVLDPLAGDEGRDSLWVVSLGDGQAQPWAESPEGVRWLSAVAEDSQRVWLTDYTDTLFVGDGAQVEPVSLDLRACVFENPADGLVWLCGERPYPYIFYTSGDGGIWEGKMAFVDVVLAECQADEPDVIDEQPEQEAPAVVPSDPEGVSRQGCASVGQHGPRSAGPWWALGWWAVLLLTRRREGRRGERA